MKWFSLNTSVRRRPAKAGNVQTLLEEKKPTTEFLKSCSLLKNNGKARKKSSRYWGQKFLGTSSKGFKGGASNKYVHHFTPEFSETFRKRMPLMFWVLPFLTLPVFLCVNRWVSFNWTYFFFSCFWCFLGLFVLLALYFVDIVFGKVLVCLNQLPLLLYWTAVRAYLENIYFFTFKSFCVSKRFIAVVSTLVCASLENYPDTCYCYS